MEFTNRHDQTSQAAPATPSSRRSRLKNSNLFNMATSALFVSLTVLLVALLWFVVLGKPNTEARSVDASKLQAVFLNGGQVYFGDITNLNDQYVRLVNIYYLRVNQQVQPDGEQAATNDISLVKLGCELHGPTDEMLINRDQVIFWENLKDDGQVAEAVAKYVQQNPNGQNCEQQATPTDDAAAPAEE